MHYLVAHKPSHYALCHRLMKEQGMGNERMGWPTLLAYDTEGKFAGFCATEKRKDAVVCGPLAIVKGKGLGCALKLISAYEAVLINCGIKFYWFHVLNNNPQWKSLLEKFIARYGGITQLGEDELGTWYSRELYAKAE